MSTEQLAIEASAVEGVEEQIIEDDPTGAEITVSTEGGKRQAVRYFVNHNS